MVWVEVRIDVSEPAGFEWWAGFVKGSGEVVGEVSRLGKGCSLRGRRGGEGDCQQVGASCVRLTLCSLCGSSSFSAIGATTFGRLRVTDREMITDRGRRIRTIIINVHVLQALLVLLGDCIE